MSRILMVAQGSFGDLFPMFAIAGELQEHGHQVIFACPANRLSSVEVLGVEGVALDRPGLPSMPSRHPSWLKRRLDKILAISTNHLAEEIAVLMPLAESADILVSNQLAFAAALVAEYQSRKWVYCAISPLAVYSANDPPQFPVLHALPFARLRWARMRRIELAIARAVAGQWSAEISRQRRRLNLPDRGHPLFEGKFSSDLNLFLCSPALIRPQADWPPHTVLTGFCWFEPNSFGTLGEGEALHAFLERGAPPVVIALSSDSRSRPGRFYHVSIAACRRLGLRSVVVADPRFHADLPGGDDVLITGYQPYSRLLGRALLVIHSAGIGTLGWCLKYGKYSILSPGAEDQFDIADRAARCGYATVIPRSRFNPDRLTSALRAFLEDLAWNARGKCVSGAIGQENGARAARRHIETLLDGSSLQND